MSVLERPQLGTDFTLSHGDQLYEAEQGTDSCQSVVRELCYIQLLSASVLSGLGHCWGVNAGAGLGEEGVQPLSPDMAFPSQGACFFPLNPSPDP